MVSSQIIKKTIDELHAITKVDFSVYESGGIMIASTMEDEGEFTEAVRLFSASQADSQEVRGNHFFKILDEGAVEYILIARGSGEDVHVMGKVAVSQIQNLLVAYKERYDKSTFIQNLLLDNLLLVDIYNRAKKLHISTEARRVVYVIETTGDVDTTPMEVLRSIYGSTGKDFLTAVDEQSIILVHELDSENADSELKDENEVAQTIIGMLETEAMCSARVSFGTAVDEIQQVSRSFKEARMAMDVGKIFYQEKRIHAYSTLGIGRLIYQLPMNLCEMFMNEVFTRQKPDTFDEETLTTINKFFENNLNVSETARQLFVHRNTLVYRLEKLQKSTGLDIRSFEDALTFKIALMVVSYMNYMKLGRPE